MVYRDFGKTGLKVSALGFGAMRLPEDVDEAVTVMRHAFDQGVNFLDTAPVYGDSEIKCGKALEGRRDQVMLSTKIPSWEEGPVERWRERLDNSLRRLSTSYIDVLQVIHGLAWPFFEEHMAPKGKICDMAERARDEGLIHHFSFSTHDSPEGVLKLIETGWFEGLIAQYNFLDRQYEKCFEAAAERGMGVVVMGPVGGGRLAGLSSELMKLVPGDVASNPEAALRFVLANRNVSSAISGMNTTQMVDENVRTCSREEPMSAEEWERVGKALDECRSLAELYCTGCGYCMPCPHGVDIPGNFSLMNHHRVYGLTDWAKRRYAHKPKEREEGDEKAKLYAGACTECGECEPKCPQKIPIIQQLAETHTALGA